MRNIHFNQLSEELRARLTLIFKEEGDVSPLIKDRLEVGAASFTYGFALFFFALATFVVISHQYGEILTSGHAPWWIILYALSLFVTFYCGLKLFVLKRLEGRLPFPPGLYLFPLDLIDARDSVLKLVSTDEVERIELDHQYNEEVYLNTELIFHLRQDGKLKMTVVGEQLAQELVQRFESARDQALRALAAQDTIALSSVDPFLAVRLDPQGWERYSDAPVKVQHGPATRELIGPLRHFWIVAMVLSIGLSPLIWLARQRLHDTARFEAAKAMPLTGEPNRVQALEVYLDDGLFHREEAVEEALPQARFEVAKAHSHQALRELLIQHPNFKLKDQVEAELYELFRTGLAQYKAQTNPAHPEALVFMTKLMAYMERQKERSWKVVLMPADVEQLEAPLAAALTQERADHLGRAVMTQLRIAFNMVAHSNVLPLELGYERPVIEVDAHGERRFKALRFPVPTLLIDYTARAAAAVDDPEALAKTGGRLSFDFQVWLYIPGDDEPLSMTFKIEPAAQDLHIPDDFIPSEPHSALYDGAVSAAFYRFSKALLTYFFAPDSKVGKRLSLTASAP